MKLKKLIRIKLNNTWSHRNMALLFYRKLGGEETWKIKKKKSNMR